MTEDSLTYDGSGVRYDTLDAFKRLALKEARTTALNINWMNENEFRDFEPSRGESVHLIEAAKSYFAHVNEGLGTKNLIADEMFRLTGVSFYQNIAQCNVAMEVNDLITLGALPLSFLLHVASGDESWFTNERFVRDLIDGTKRACNMSGCTWGGGETPILKDIIAPGVVLLSGSASGIVKPKEHLIRGNIEDGDDIVVFESSGIHANGLTLARKIAGKLKDGYLTLLTPGRTRTYGVELLQPTTIYMPVMERLLRYEFPIHYAVNITGHGWRKFMRAKQPFSYVIEEMPRLPPIFEFIQQHGPVEEREMYSTFNMGAGFAVYVPKGMGAVIVSSIDSMEDSRFRAYVAGHVEQSESKKVVIKPKNIVFEEDSMQLR